VSDEPAATIQTFIKKHGCTYTFVSSREANKNYGIKAFPTEYAIDPKGKVSNQDAVSNCKDCDVPPAGDYSKKLDNARKAMHSGDFKTAAAELAKLEKDTGKDGENAKNLEKWIDDHGTRRIAEADALRDAGDVITARDIYAEVQKTWGPKSDAVKSAKDKLAELQKDKDAKKALGQDKVWYQAVAAEDANDSTTAATLYAKCAKAASGTKFGDFCEKKAKTLK